MFRKCVSLFIGSLFAVSYTFAQKAVSDTQFPVRAEVRLVEEKGTFYGEEPLFATLHLSNVTK